MLRVFADTRRIGATRYYLAREEHPSLQIPPELRRCVAFVYSEQSDGKHPQGTLFFVAIPMESIPDRHHVYAVTSRHVLEGIRDDGADGKAWLRINLRNGQARFIETDVNDWRYHPDPSVDVAIAMISLFPDAAQSAWHLDSRVTDAAVAEYEVDVGNELLITGLFVHHVGSTRNVPIVRVGNIAAMPQHISMSDQGTMEAYLIESRSLGGLSGSPVFLNLGMLRIFGGRATLAPGRNRPDAGFLLLGMVYGHYRERARRIDQTEEMINAGIAIVVPIKYVVEAITQSEEDALRKNIEQQLKKSGGPVADRARGLTEEEFHNVLKKVSKKAPTSQPGREKKGT